MSDTKREHVGCVEDADSTFCDADNCWCGQPPASPVAPAPLDQFELRGLERQVEHFRMTGENKMLEVPAAILSQLLNVNFVAPVATGETGQRDEFRRGLEAAALRVASKYDNDALADEIRDIGRLDALPAGTPEQVRELVAEFRDLAERVRYDTDHDPEYIEADSFEVYEYCAKRLEALFAAEPQG